MSRANAEKLVHQLKATGSVVYVTSSGSGPSLRYRVRTGPYADRAAAEHAAAKLKAAGPYGDHCLAGIVISHLCDGFTYCAMVSRQRPPRLGRMASSGRCNAKGGSLTGADVLILLVLLGSTLIGLLRGFVREAVSLGFWIVAIWAAWRFGSLVEPHLGGVLADPRVAPWVGRLVILVLVLLARLGHRHAAQLLHAQRRAWGRSTGSSACCSASCAGWC